LPDRLQNYEGPTTIGSEVFDADLEDDLLMLGLAKDVAIKQVMDIKQSDFCYGYNEL
jgi:hypothetical protein